MGVGIAIAAVAVAATVASDVGFAVAESNKQDELEDASKKAKAAVNSVNDLYQNVYKVIKTRLEHLKQSMTKLPPDVVDKLNQDLKLNLNDPAKAVQCAGWALGGSSLVVGVAGLVSSGLVTAELAAADGVIAEIGAVAGDVIPVLAFAGFGLSLYNGITGLEKLNDAIDNVNKRRQDAENAMAKMKASLDGLLKSMKLQVGKYEQLKNISDDWAKLAANFDKQSTAFYYAITGFAMGKSQAQVHDFIRNRGSVDLRDDILALAKLIQGNILDMMKQGKTDEQIINFYAKENPHEGLRFLMDPFFVSTLRAFIK